MNLLKRQKFIPPSTQSGFTIMEALVAIIVVSLLMTAIAPVFVLSVATRVQARRVELATEAARSYTDGVRAGTILPPPISNTELKDVDAPTAGALDCDNTDANGGYCTTPADLYCIDLDGDSACTSDSLKDMIVQGAGYQPTAIYVAANTNLQNAENGYTLGVRVYQANAFSAGRTLRKGTEDEGNDRAAATFTGGTGLRDPQAPLMKTTTEITTNDTSFQDLCKRIWEQNPDPDSTAAADCTN
jgi:type II secretory pathway pseudopilin PulG